MPESFNSRQAWGPINERVLVSNRRPKNYLVSLNSFTLTDELVDAVSVTQNSAQGLRQPMELEPTALVSLQEDLGFIPSILMAHNHA